MLGIRTDKSHSLDSDLLIEAEPPISVYDAIGDLPRLRSRISRKIADGGDTFINWQTNIENMPMNLNGEAKDIESNITNTISEIIKSKGQANTGGRFTSEEISINNNSSNFMKQNWSWFHDGIYGLLFMLGNKKA